MATSSEQQNEIELRKYCEIYKQSKTALKEELERSYRMDEKASKYLTVLSLLLGAILFFFDRVLELIIIPPQDLIDFFIILTVISLVISTLIAWWFVFSALRIHSYIKEPMDNDTLLFYDNNNLIDIYYAMSKGNISAISKNKNTGDLKSKSLYRGYKAMVCSVVILSVLFVLTFFQHFLTAAS